MSDSRAIVKDALGIVRRELKQRGYASQGFTFHRRATTGNTLLIQVQKSRASNDALTSLAVNYGVFSARIGKALQGKEISHDVAEAHVRRRVHESGTELWLRISERMAVDDAAAAILPVVLRAADDVEALGCDVAIRDLWLTGSSPGMVNLQRLVNLAVLLTKIGPADALPDVLSELYAVVTGKPQEPFVRSRLSAAGVELAP